MKNKNIVIKKNNVRKRRLSMTNLTQYELSKKISISLSVYREIENNKRNIKYIYARKIIDFFDISINQLFD